MYKDWFYIALHISEKGYSLTEKKCPKCNAKELEYAYVGNLETQIGYLDIWCNNCKHGIQISRVKIPKDSRVIDIYDEDMIDSSIPLHTLIHPSTSE